MGEVRPRGDLHVLREAGEGLLPPVPPAASAAVLGLEAGESRAREGEVGEGVSLGATAGCEEELSGFGLREESHGN